MMRARRAASLIATSIVAVIWATTAVTKVAAPPDAESWLVTFPAWVQYSVIFTEAVAAAALLAGMRRFGLALGLGLLLAFAAALLVSPPTPGQSCGCLGSLPIDSAPRDVAAHLFSFAALHMFAAVLVIGGRCTSSPVPMHPAGRPGLTRP